MLMKYRNQAYWSVGEVWHIIQATTKHFTYSKNALSHQCSVMSTSGWLLPSPVRGLSECRHVWLLPAQQEQPLQQIGQDCLLEPGDLRMYLRQTPHSRRTASPEALHQTPCSVTLSPGHFLPTPGASLAPSPIGWSSMGAGGTLVMYKNIFIIEICWEKYQ